MTTITAYPLAWPEGWKRTKGQEHGRFGKKVVRPGRGYASTEDLTVAEAITRVLAELQRMGLGRDDVVISTNLVLRMDGLPRSDQRAPADCGVAVYWEDRQGGRKVMAIDRYYTVADNLAAVAATLDAMRAIERHGGAAILDRAFTGFVALPPPGPAADRPWWEVLGVPKLASLTERTEAYRRLRSLHHPDKNPGDAEAAARFNEVEQAYRKATS